MRESLHFNSIEEKIVLLVRNQRCRTGQSLPIRFRVLVPVKGESDEKWKFMSRNLESKISPTNMHKAQGHIWGMAEKLLLYFTKICAKI